MKKFLMLLFVFLFSTSSANAGSTFVKYNNAGFPISVTRGYGRPVSISQARQYNYPRTSRPSVPSRPACPHRYMARRTYITPMLTRYNPPIIIQTSADNSTSRFNRNTRANIPQSSYTMNGVTYYN